MISLLLAAAAPEPDLAFVARYYKQGKAKSTYRVFLARHDGTGIRIAPGAPEGTMSLSWVDHDTLALVRDVDDKSSEVIAYDVRTKKSWVVAKVSAFSYFSKDPAGADFLAVDGKAFRVSRDKITEVTYPSDDVPFGKPVNATDDASPWSGTVKLGNGRVANLTYKPGFDNDDGEFDVAVAAGETKHTYHLKGLQVESAMPSSGRGLFVVTSVPFRKVNRVNRLYRLDTESGKAELLVDGVGNLSFTATSPWWTAEQAEGSPMTKLKDGRQVYTNWLYTGNWKTGEKWTVATGLVNVSRAVFRP